MTDVHHDDDGSERSGGYSRAEWTNLSIQDRIRAMNDSIPDPKTINHIDSMSIPSTNRDDDTLNEEEQPYENDLVEEAPRRSSVVDIWRKREGGGGSEPTSSSWKKPNSSPPTSAPPEAAAAAPPKRSSVADIWNQRQKEETPTATAAPPAWKKEAVPENGESVVSPRENAASFWNQQEKHQQAAGEEPPSWKKDDVVVSPAKRSSVASMWQQKQQDAGEPGQEDSVEEPSPPKRSSVTDIWKQRVQQQQTPPPQEEQEVSPPKRSSVADIWNQRQQATTTASPRESTPPQQQQPSWKKDTSPPQDDEVSPPKRSSVADIWKQRQQQASPEESSSSVPSWKRSPEESTVPSWKKPTNKPPLPPPPPPPQPNVADLFKASKPSGLSKPVPTDETDLIIEAGSGSFSDVEVPHHHSPNVDDIWRKRDPEVDWPTGDDDDEVLVQEAPKRTSVVDVWTKRESSSSTTPSWKKDDPPTLTPEQQDPSPRSSVVSMWKKREEESSAGPSKAPSWQSSGSWKGQQQQQQQDSSPKTASWKKSPSSELPPPKKAVTPPWVKKEEEEPSADEAQETPPKSEEVVPSWKRPQVSPINNGATPPWVKQEKEPSTSSPTETEEHDEETPRSSVMDMWKKREEGSASKDTDIRKSPSEVSSVYSTSSKAKFQNWWEQQPKEVTDSFEQDVGPSFDDTPLEQKKALPPAPVTSPTKPSWVKEDKVDASPVSSKPDSPAKRINGVYTDTVQNPSSVARSSPYLSPATGTPRLGASPLSTKIEKPQDSALSEVSAFSVQVDDPNDEPGRIVLSPKKSPNKNWGSPENKKKLQEQRRRLRKIRPDRSDDISDLSDPIDSIPSADVAGSRSAASETSESESVPPSVKDLIANIAAETHVGVQNRSIPENREVIEVDDAGTPHQEVAKDSKIVAVSRDPPATNAIGIEPIRPPPVKPVNRYQHNKLLAARNESKPKTPVSDAEPDFSLFHYNEAGIEKTPSPKSAVSGNSNVSALSTRASKVLQNRRKAKAQMSMTSEEQAMARDLARKVLSGSSSNLEEKPVDKSLESKEGEWETFDSAEDWGTNNLDAPDTSSSGNAPTLPNSTWTNNVPPAQGTTTSTARDFSMRTNKPSSIPVTEENVPPPPADTPTASQSFQLPTALTKGPPVERSSLANRYQTSDRFLDAVHNMVDEAKKTFNLGDQERRTYSFGSEGTGSSYHHSEGGSLETPSIGPVRSESTDGQSNFSSRTPNKHGVNEGIVTSGFVEENATNMDELRGAVKTTNLQQMAVDTLADMSDGLHESFHSMSRSLNLDTVAKDIQKYLPNQLTPGAESNGVPQKDPSPQKPDQSQKEVPQQSDTPPKKASKKSPGRKSKGDKSPKPSLKLPDIAPDSPTQDTDVAIEVEYFEEEATAVSPEKPIKATKESKAGSRFPFGRSNNKKGLKLGRKSSKQKSRNLSSGAAQDDQKAFV